MFPRAQFKCPSAFSTADSVSGIDDTGCGDAHFVRGDDWGLVGLSSFGYDFKTWVTDSVGIATNQASQAKVAVKFYLLDKKEKRNAMQREVDLLRSFTHEAVVRLEGVYTSKFDVWLCFEHCAGGSVQEHVKNVGAFSENKSFALSNQIHEGINYLHGLGVVHRDLTSSNLLLVNDKDVKICDFKNAMVLGSDDFGREVLDDCPLTVYVAPEAILRGEWSPASDIWSFGVCVFYMSMADLPFAYEMEDIKIAAEEGRLPDDKRIRDVPETLRPLVEHCLAINPDERSCIPDEMNAL